jgi:hypothetical protein
MSISESQLETWSHQGSVTQSAATYDTLRRTLDDPKAPYAARDYSTFLQGSYGNNTNIHADSDVDVVMRLDSVYYSDTSELSPDNKAAFDANFSPAEYSWTTFRDEVITQLRGAYDSSVVPGNKAVFVSGNGTRRDADVLPAAVFRRYFEYTNPIGQRVAEGICFWLPDATQIINYPKQHAANCTAKHQRTNAWFKPVVRIAKNMRNAMVAKGLIASGLAPSYFVEGMLYNVTDASFGGSYGDTLFNVMNWLRACDRDQLLCANEQYFLIHPSSAVTWRREQFEAFLNALINFWNAGG